MRVIMTALRALFLGCGVVVIMIMLMAVIVIVATLRTVHMR